MRLRYSTQVNTGEGLWDGTIRVEEGSGEGVEGTLRVEKRTMRVEERAG